VRMPEFTVRLEHQATIADGGDKLQLKVQLNKVDVGGDINYRGFDLGEVLLPEEFTYKVKLLNAKSQVVQELTKQRLSLRGKQKVMWEATIPDTAAAQQYKLTVEDKLLAYAAADVQRLREHLALIRDYFAADATLQQAVQDAGRIIPDDVDRIRLHERSLQELEALHARLKGQFSSKLNLSQNDPQRLKTKLEQLQHVLQERRHALNYTLATLDQQYFNRGLVLANSRNYSAAQAYFRKSIEVNPQFAPAHVQLARIDFVNGYLPEAANRLRDVLTRMRIDPGTEAVAMGLAHDIYSTHISNGNNLTSRGAYHEALDAFAAARHLCSTIGGLRCSMPALSDSEARAARGAYRAILDKGKGLMARNALQEAEHAAEEALRFQQEYADVLHAERDAKELLGQVKFQMYLQYIDQGKRYLAQSNHAAALGQFEEALALEQKYMFKPVQELGKLAQRAAKPVLLAKLSQGYEEARQNRLGSARELTSDATAMQERFGLQADAEVQRKFKLLGERIFTQECANTQAAYDQHLAHAKALAKERQYLAADRAYAEAISAASAKSECSIATFTAKDGQTAIAPAANYQRKLEEIDRLVTSSRYQDAIRGYNEAEKHYLFNQVNKFGLDHISLFNYAKDNLRQTFTASVVEHFTQLGEEPIAIQLLTSLLEKGYSKGKTKKVQEHLGRQLAVKDAIRNLKDAPKVLAAGHSGNNKDLKKLRKTYEKERKKLSGQG